MDLALRVDEDATEEEDEASDGEEGGSEQLYVDILFLIHNGTINFVFHGAKVQQKIEPTKKVGSESVKNWKSFPFSAIGNRSRPQRSSIPPL